MSIIFVFLDGVGLAPVGPDNPLSDAPMPALQTLLGGPLTREQVNKTNGTERRRVRLTSIDATLGVAGLPQSGTGQTALFAGFNAAALHGRHQPHFPPVALRGMLAEHSIFRRVLDISGSPAFANAFGPGYWEAVATRRIRRSASVIAAEGAGVRFRDDSDLRAGRAVSWDITGAAQRQRGIDAPTATPAAAGASLARLAHDHQLVVFETFLPDLAGHGRLEDERPTTKDRRPKTEDQRPTTEDRRLKTEDRRPKTEDRRPKTEDQGNDQEATSARGGSERTGDSDAAAWSSVFPPWSVKEQIHAAMARIDGLLDGVLAAMRAEDTLVVTSDHGNVESLAAPAHTRNPVPLLATGPGASNFAAVTDISEVADAILTAIQESSA